MIQRAALFTLVALAVCAVFLFFFVNKTRLGRAMQATSQDPDTSRLMGINVDRIIMVAFALGAALAAVAGLAYGLRYTNIDFRIGFLAGLKAFTAAVLGGIGNINGAVVGGLVLGRRRGDRHLATSLVTFGGSAWKDVWAFVLADPGAGVQTSGPARSEGGGPGMSVSSRSSRRHCRSGSTARRRIIALVGGALLVIAPFLPWAYSSARSTT